MRQKRSFGRCPLTLTLDKLRRTIATRCLDCHARPRDEMVQLLVTYKKQHRHLRVCKVAPAPWTALPSVVDSHHSLYIECDGFGARALELRT